MRTSRRWPRRLSISPTRYRLSFRYGPISSLMPILFVRLLSGLGLRMLTLWIIGLCTAANKCLTTAPAPSYSSTCPPRIAGMIYAVFYYFQDSALWIRGVHRGKPIVLEVRTLIKSTVGAAYRENVKKLLRYCICMFRDPTCPNPSLKRRLILNPGERSYGQEATRKSCRPLRAVQIHGYSKPQPVTLPSRRKRLRFFSTPFFS